MDLLNSIASFSIIILKIWENDKLKKLRIMSESKNRQKALRVTELKKSRIMSKNENPRKPLKLAEMKKQKSCQNSKFF